MRDAFGFWLWTIIVLLLALYIGGNLAADVTVTDPSKPFITGKTVVVAASSTVWVEAGSSNFFLLRNGKHVLYGVQGTPQLGSTNAEYYALDGLRHEMVPGVWRNVVGYPAFRITSETPVTVTLVVADKLLHWFWVAVWSIVGWGLGLLLDWIVGLD